jgi:hypothetical protein
VFKLRYKHFTRYYDKTHLSPRCVIFHDLAVLKETKSVEFAFVAICVRLFHKTPGHTVAVVSATICINVASK